MKTFSQTVLEQCDAILKHRESAIAELQGIADSNNLTYTTGGNVQVTGLLALVATQDTSEYDLVRIAAQQHLDKLIDELLALSLSVPDERSDEITKEVDKLFNDFDSVDPTQLSDAAMAIYGPRYLLSKNRVTFQPASLKNWGAFSERFQDLILAS